MSTIRTGLTSEITRLVQKRHLAPEWGSGLAPVLATPALVAFCEECARLAVDAQLPDGQQTVGTRIDIRHLAATPPGMEVTVRAELIGVQGRRLNFRIEAWDDYEKIGESEHERYVVDTDRFQTRIDAKEKKPEIGSDLVDP
jgi:predicted thioesterase